MTLRTYIILLLSVLVAGGVTVLAAATVSASGGMTVSSSLAGLSLIGLAVFISFRILTRNR